MEHAVAVLEAYCRRRGWMVEWADEATLVMSIDVEHGRLFCTVAVDDRRLVVESLYSFVVPPSRRILAAEFAARANRRIEVGALAVDLDDGEVGCKTGVAIAGERWDLALAGSLMEEHLQMADRWLPGVAALCYADLTPRAALELCMRTSVAEVMERASALLDRE